jgi:hypothetical protein
MVANYFFGIDYCIYICYNYTESYATVAPWHTIDVIHIEAYFIYGGTISVRFNIQPFYEELIKIYE